MTEAEDVPDRIRKEIIVGAPRSRVWRAVSEAKEFGVWFGVEFDGPFAPGMRMTGRIVPTKVDAEVAKLQEPNKGMPFHWSVEGIEPERSISFRWHPFAVEKNVDYSNEPTTLIVFELTEVAGGTLLTITESGFGELPLARRSQAFAANDGGW